MWERRPEVCPVNVGLSGAFREKETVTARAKYIYSVVPGQVRKTDGKDGLALTKYVWATPEGCDPILLVHSMHPPIRNNVTILRKRNGEKIISKQLAVAAIQKTTDT